MRRSNLLSFALLLATSPVVTRNSMMAEPGLSRATMHAVVYTLLSAALVLLLLIGGILIVNLGLLSKRAEDRVGKRSPSDLGLLKTEVWPEEPEDQAKFPATEEGREPESEGDETKKTAV